MIDNPQSSVLTIIVPTYNHEKWIARCLDSILSQETDFSFAIWVLEDCSTDQTCSICREYAEKYPEKIRLFAREKNLGVLKNVQSALIQIKSRYWGALEGDDYWCDNHKLQMQIDVLEANPDCSMCGHDTLVKDLATDKEWSFIRNLMEPRGRIKFSLETNPFWTHPSARIYRNIVAISKIPPVMLFDTAILYVYQSVGDCYYIDRIMSVYNLTGTGIWTGVHRLRRRMLSLRESYAKSKYCNFKFDSYIGPYSRLRKGLKLFFGKRIGWFIFFHYRINTLRAMLLKERFLKMLNPKSETID